MLTFIKILLGVCLVLIFIQDLKERKVYLFLFIGVGIMMSYLFYRESLTSIYLLQMSFNIMVIALVLMILYLYASIVLKKSLHQTFGLGDMLFFLSIAIGFSSGVFLILFSFSLLFSGLVYLLLKNSKQNPTIPLAGYQALFFFFVYGCNWIFAFTNLYSF